MKKLALTLAALALSAAPAVAKDRHVDRSPSILECGIFFIPANCSPLDRIVGGAIVGGALGFGVGAAGGSIAGGTLAATSTVGVAGSYAVIGAGAGATTGLLVAR